MNLNAIAEQDLGFTIEDVDNGFGVNIVLKYKANSYPVAMKTNDIGFFIDLQSGTGVQGRQVGLDGRISTIENLASDLPSKQWSVDYVDTNGKTWSCSIANVIPDRKLGIYKLVLEALNKNALI